MSTETTASPSASPISPGVAIFAITALAVGAVIYLKTQQMTANGQNSPAVGKVLTGVQLNRLTGVAAERIDDDSLAGKVTLINFWGYWCPPCVEEFPHLQEVSAKLGAHEDFQFVSVSCHPALGGGDEQNLRERTTVFFDYVKRAPQATYHDLSGDTRAVIADAIEQQHIAFPCTVLVDRNARIHGVWLGYSPSDPQQIEQLAARLLTHEDSQPAPEKGVE